MVKIYEVKGKLYDKIQELIEKTEEKLTGDQIIELRLYLFQQLIETNCGWKEKGDCLPTYIKVGAYGNDYITLEYHK